MTSVFTSWGQVSQDRVEDAVQITEVVPALFDRREARAWLASSRGGYTPLSPMPLPPSVHHVEAGPPGIPAVALVDGGLAALRVREVDGAPRLLLERIIESRLTVLDGSDAYLPALQRHRAAATKPEL